MGYDMHVHTTASDGIFQPEEIVDWGIKEGLAGLAITDHDTVDGVRQAVVYGEARGFVIIPGIELSCEYERVFDGLSKTQSVHILGYLFDYENQKLVEQLAYLQQMRRQRAGKILALLADHGICLGDKILTDLSGPAAIGRPTIARQMIDQGYVETMAEAFSKWLGVGQVAYVPRVKITPFQAVDMIKAAGGASVFAHPFLAESDELIPELAAYGLAGLEVYHPKHDEQTTEKYLQLALENNLVITGGSDCHEADLGRWFTEKSQLDKLKKAAAK